ncbi:hypothetical protein GQ43DRAFT_443605 [Delitschia confertaspora ATCC 74209]|uniref:RNA polymerase III RPC4 n=1 Tax=Delitschia confertaspora ATCC 74209 TaxID=1513339 RepID=A0A9P4MPE5_9PLEO|nr:hypothetical protein GQ43DRAFT_443605 [Delitschia confertaspora ATCC 74209]
MPPKGRPKASGAGRVTAANSESPAAAVTAESSAAPSNTAPESASEPTTQESNTPAATTTRRPAQRLDSLKTASGSPATSQSARGGASTRGRGKTAAGLARQPVFKGRRSKEEREALEKEAREKDRARRAELEREERKQNRGNHRGGRGRGDGAGRGRGRGGFMGDASFSALSGPFSAGRFNGAATQRSQFGGGSGGGYGGSRASVVKGEPRFKMEGDDADMRRALGISIKQEDGGYVSSENEEDEESHLPKKNIDLIDLVSDEEDGASAGVRKSRGALPVRIGRKEHKERVLGLNTEASAPSVPEDTENADGSAPADGTEAALRKTKSKGKELEITEIRKPYRGVWQEGDDESNINIKPEPQDDDADMNNIPEGDGTELAAGSVFKQPPSSPESEKKPRPRHKRPPVGAAPALQTEEDKQEWERYQRSLSRVRYEFGPEIPIPGTTKKAEVADASGDVVMGEDQTTAEDTKEMHNPRRNNVYLFQLPPVIPDLIEPGIKKEQSEAKHDPLITSTNTEETSIKIEEGADGPTPQAPDSNSPRLTSGYVGKMRVFESGRAMITWGGLRFEVKTGMGVNFCQEAVCAQVTPVKERINDDDGGLAASFGPIAGRFVVTPDWEDLLG